MFSVFLKHKLYVSTRLLSVLLLLGSLPATAIERIISLAPHTTELLFSLGVGDKVIAVSDYSDYPPEAQQLPSVADYNGVDFEAIMRLQPELIVAWQGGNKPQDLARLASLGFRLFYSSSQKPEDIATEITQLGTLVGQTEQASLLAEQFNQQLGQLRQQYAGQVTIPAFYYMWNAPLMTIGQQAWATQLLSICGAQNIFADAAVAYPEVSLEQVAKRRPQVIIAAQKISQQDAETFWQDKQTYVNGRVMVVNPDQLHRFSPRLISGLRDMCEKIHAE